MSYGNQQDHEVLDRIAIKEYLVALVGSSVVASPTDLPRAQHLDALLSKCDSELERRWLRWVNERGLKLPSANQVFVQKCGTRPDFVYEDANAVIYIDGPPHDHPDRQKRDSAQQEAMEDLGYEVIRFHHEDDWNAVRGRYPHVFGNGG